MSAMLGAHFLEVIDNRLIRLESTWIEEEEDRYAGRWFKFKVVMGYAEGDYVHFSEDQVDTYCKPMNEMEVLAWAANQ